ncbi:hypothetical protein GVAV_001024 [Gurleya vavrai]
MQHDDSENKRPKLNNENAEKQKNTETDSSKQTESRVSQKFDDIDFDGEIKTQTNSENEITNLSDSLYANENNSSSISVLQKTKMEEINSESNEKEKKISKLDQKLISVDKSINKKNKTQSEIINDTIHRMRLYMPYIHKYGIDHSFQSMIVSTFINKVEQKNFKKTIEEDPFYMQYLKEEKDDIEELIKDEKIKERFNCKRLRMIDFQLLNEMRNTRREIENLILIFKKVYKKIKGEEEKNF